MDIQKVLSFPSTPEPDTIYLRLNGTSEIEIGVSDSTGTAIATLPVSLGSPETLSTVRSNKDTEGIFTTISRYRGDSTLYAVSVLSGGTSPQYTTRTETYYESDGVTVDRVYVYALTYDGAGDLVAETLT